MKSIIALSTAALFLAVASAAPAWSSPVQSDMTATYGVTHVETDSIPYPHVHGAGTADTSATRTGGPSGGIN